MVLACYILVFGLIFGIFLNDSAGSHKKARQEDLSGASIDEIMEAMNYGIRRKSRKVWHFMTFFLIVKCCNLKGSLLM